ncbi:hypothetical protein [Acinetobacter phage vB_AbaM_fThrA]|nr:hypothetical protein [Acinetobacter phage vB_AbaM_fThrA]
MEKEKLTKLIYLIESLDELLSVTIRCRYEDLDFLSKRNLDTDRREGEIQAYESIQGFIKEIKDCANDL